MEVEVQVLSSRLDVSDGVQLRHRNHPTSPRAGRRGGEGEGRERVKEGGMEEGGGEGRREAWRREEGREGSLECGGGGE